jgi:hypothetical protein
MGYSISNKSSCSVHHIRFKKKVLWVQFYQGSTKNPWDRKHNYGVEIQQVRKDYSRKLSNKETYIAPGILKSGYVYFGFAPLFRIFGIKFLYEFFILKNVELYLWVWHLGCGYLVTSSLYT